MENILEITSMVLIVLVGIVVISSTVAPFVVELMSWKMAAKVIVVYLVVGLVLGGWTHLCATLLGNPVNWSDRFTALFCWGLPLMVAVLSGLFYWTKGGRQLFNFYFGGVRRDWRYYNEMKHWRS